MMCTFIAKLPAEVMGVSLLQKKNLVQIVVRLLFSRRSRREVEWVKTGASTWLTGDDDRFFMQSCCSQDNIFEYFGVLHMLDAHWADQVGLS